MSAIKKEVEQEVILKEVNPVAVINQHKTSADKLIEQYTGIVYDLTDDEGIDKAKEDKKVINSAINKLDATHKECKADILEQGRQLDGARKSIKDRLLEVKDSIIAQEKAQADKLEAHNQALRARVEEINTIASSTFGMGSSEHVSEAIKRINDIKIDDSFEFLEAEAALAKMKALESLNSELEAINAKEAEAKAEQERQAAEAKKEQEEREKRLVAEAKEAAEREAQQKIDDAEAQRKAAEKAESDKLAKAEQALKDQAAQAERDKQAAIEAETKRINDEAEAKAKKEAAEAKILKKKKANQDYRAKIHKAAKASFIAQSYSEEESTKLVTIIRDGLIDNVTIDY